jgi:uncharacterized membrane protein
VPTSGYFEIVEEENIIHTNLTIDDCIKIVVSGGMILPDSVLCGKTLVKAPEPIADAFTLTPKPESSAHDK